MKHLSCLALILGLTLATSNGFAQNLGLIPGKAATAAAGISVQSNGSKYIVIYQGKTVFAGATKSKPVAKAKNINGRQYAAAYDGNKVIWENVKGAGALLMR